MHDVLLISELGKVEGQLYFIVEFNLKVLESWTGRSLLFTHVQFFVVCWYASCPLVLAAVNCAFINKQTNKNLIP